MATSCLSQLIECFCLRRTLLPWLSSGTSKQLTPRVRRFEFRQFAKQLSHALIQRVERLPLLFDENFAQNSPERTHVAAERPVNFALPTHG